MAEDGQLALRVAYVQARGADSSQPLSQGGRSATQIRTPPTDHSDPDNVHLWYASLEGVNDGFRFLLLRR